MTRDRITGIAIAAFVVVTAVLLAPGYLEKAGAQPPRDAEYHVKRAFETRARVFDDQGQFGRLPQGAEFAAVESFVCAPSADARRAFGWRGAREVLFYCPARFRDNNGRVYTWTFRLIPDDDPIAETSPEGYRGMHIPVETARALLTQRGMLR